MEAPENGLREQAVRQTRLVAEVAQQVVYVVEGIIDVVQIPATQIVEVVDMAAVDVAGDVDAVVMGVRVVIVVVDVQHVADVVDDPVDVIVAVSLQQLAFG
jgi:hypothetical protein